MSGMLVKHLMTPNVSALSPHDDLAAVRDLMVERHIRHVPIIDSEGDLVGLVTHRDLLRFTVPPSGSPAAEGDPLALVSIEEAMVREVRTVNPATDLREAAQIMYENKYGCLPVLDDRLLVGILTEADFVQLMARGN
ncbi:MAG TPA: CBS domain-containing protein [Thermoanaerobaculia bacterium]|nr:CBS domain-containing protein [Thermoanaerobaculia bacterium]